MFGLIVFGRRGFFPSETTDWSCDATRGTLSFTCIGAQIPRRHHKTYELKDIYFGKDLENQEAEPHQKIPRSTSFRSPGGGYKSCRHNHRVEWMIQISVIIQV